MKQIADTAYILCGGQSRRMGEDKLFLPIGKQTLLARAIDTCRSCFSTVKLVAPADTKFSDLDYEVVSDYSGCKGPLAGIISAVRDCRTTYCFITAVDFPSLTPDLIDRLLLKLNSQQYVGVGESSRLQPLCGFYSKTILPALCSFADDGGRKVISVVQRSDYELVEIDESCWLNVNNQEDLKRAREQYV